MIDSVQETKPEKRDSLAGLIFRLLRVKQWTKNLLLFAGALFSARVFTGPIFGRACLAFLSFCLISSALYIINDINDRERDRRHPRKQNRPIASGRVTVAAGWVVAVLLGLAGFALAAYLNLDFLLVALIYAGLTMAYTLILKHVVLIDVMTLAIGYVLRAVAGAVAVRVEISAWLLVCTLSLALFLALGKRRQEIMSAGEAEKATRRVLSEYTVAFLNQAMTIFTALTLISYFLYTFSSWHDQRLMLTVPFVIYGVFRYLLLMERGRGEEPEEVLLGDLPFLIDIILWAVASAVIIYLD